MGDKWPMAPVEHQSRQERKWQHHYYNQGFRIKRHGLIEDGCIDLKGRMPRPQTVRHQILRKTAPNITVKMLIERRREYLRTRHRLQRKEQDVGDEEQLE